LRLACYRVAVIIIIIGKKTIIFGDSERQRRLDIIPNYNQQDAKFLDLFISTDALRVSGGSCAHHQEHITVHTASGIVNQYYCLLQQSALLVDNT